MSRNLHDLSVTTNDIHYANFRTYYLKATNRRDSILACDDDYMLKVEESRQKMLEEVNRREEEIRQTFIQRVREKESSLREAEEKVRSCMKHLPTLTSN